MLSGGKRARAKRMVPTIPVLVNVGGERVRVVPPRSARYYTGREAWAMRCLFSVPIMPTVRV